MYAHKLLVIRIHENYAFTYSVCKNVLACFIFEVKYIVKAKNETYL